MNLKFQNATRDMILEAFKERSHTKNWKLNSIKFLSNNGC